MYTAIVDSTKPANLRRDLLKRVVQSFLENRPHNTTVIDHVVSEDFLHTFDPNDVLQVSYDLGFLISACCMCREQFKANGIWLKPSDNNLFGQLRIYGNLSHGFCQECYEKSYGAQEVATPSSACH